MVDLALLHEILLVSLYLGLLINNFLNLLFPDIRKSQVTVCRWYLSIELEPAKKHGKMVLSWRKTLIFVLETNWLQLNILDLIWFVSKYTTVGSSNLISLGKHAFADGSWKLRGTHLLRKKF